MFADRKTSYKLPPTTIRDKLISQEMRRMRALEGQKLRRAQRIDSSRQLDIFAELNLGGTDDEDEAEDDNSPHFAPASVAQYATMLSQTETQDGTPNPFTPHDTSSFVETSVIEQGPGTESKKKSKKRKNKRRTNKPSKWADKCMYAELLEMASDEMWSQSAVIGDQNNYSDGLPKDLETAWVALAPVPAGKRCLAVTHQSAGMAGVVPNTTLRSRLLGKILIQRFPSPLPPLTILDCILDENWRENGILHVLDVVKWKGQDVGDCEARFRFWWRDTRLAEITPVHPPSTPIFASHFVSPNQLDVGDHSSPKYRFPYPTTFIPVPSYMNTTLSALNEEIIPASRTARQVDVIIPSPSTTLLTDADRTITMDIEPTPIQQSISNSHGTPDLPIYTPHSISPSNVPTQFQFQCLRARISPDGLLLYVAEASYEPGTSPLSSWVPVSVQCENDASSNKCHREPSGGPASESPLDLFQRIIRQRLSDRMYTLDRILETSPSDVHTNETYMEI